MNTVFVFVFDHPQRRTHIRHSFFTQDTAGADRIGVYHDESFGFLQKVGIPFSETFYKLTSGTVLCISSVSGTGENTAGQLLDMQPVECIGTDHRQIQLQTVWMAILIQIFFKIGGFIGRIVLSCVSVTAVGQPVGV